MQLECDIQCNCTRLPLPVRLVKMPWLTLIPGLAGVAAVSSDAWLATVRLGAYVVAAPTNTVPILAA